MNEMANKALVLGTDSRILLSVVRSLGRGGVQVHVAAHEVDEVALASRFLHRVHPLPDVRVAEPAWHNALCELLRLHQFNLVIPCTEAEIIACHRRRHELAPLCHVYLPNERSLETLFHKFKTTELARTLQVPTPREIIVTDYRQHEQPLGDWGFPLVLKPARSIDPTRLGPVQQVRKAYTARDFKRLLGNMLRRGPVAVQENFIGAGVGVELLLSKGRPLLAFQHRRVHEPLHGGPSSYRVSEPLSGDLLAAAVRILAALDYTGVAMAEFKVNDAQDAWVFLEVNARFWGSLPLAIAAGADFPLALFKLLVNGQTTFNNHYQPGIYCRNWSLDLDWQRLNRRADRADPTLACLPISSVMRTACRNLLTGVERSDTFSWDDPRPGLMELRQIAGRMVTKVVRYFRGIKQATRHRSSSTAILRPNLG
jgi:predicted ATP-grasp superfamily ATP-dependent carboligase